MFNVQAIEPLLIRFATDKGPTEPLFRLNRTAVCPQPTEIRSPTTLTADNWPVAERIGVRQWGE